MMLFDLFVLRLVKSLFVVHVWMAPFRETCCCRSFRRVNESFSRLQQL